MYSKFAAVAVLVTAFFFVDGLDREATMAAMALPTAVAIVYWALGSA